MDLYKLFREESIPPALLNMTKLIVNNLLGYLMNMKNILITGSPGVGKTTLVKKLIKKLDDSGVDADGFLTEEIRNDRHQRTGFNIKLFKHNISGVLADKSEVPSNDNIRKLGQYTVYVKNFEDTVIERILKFDKDILIVDEIGKMELFSKKFEKTIFNVLKNPKIKVLATVPVKGPPFVENLKRDVGCKLFTVTQQNRDFLLDQIYEEVLDGVKIRDNRSE